MIGKIELISKDNALRAKDKEKVRVYTCIYRNYSITRKSIIEKTGVRPTTVSKAVYELIEDGLVVEGQQSETGRKGRPGICLHPDFNKHLSISISFHSHQIRGVLLNLGEKIVAERTVRIQADATNEIFLSSFITIIRELLDYMPLKAELLGVGISVSGSINRQEQSWIYSSRWSNLSNLPFSKLAEELNLNVRVSHFLNANLEYLMMKNPVFMAGGTLLYHWGYGIGASYAHDGTVLKSSLGSFAEVGHWQVSLNKGDLCPCGARGCLETEAALWSIRQKLGSDGTGIPENEEKFGEIILKSNLSGNPEILKARDFVEDSLVNLYHTFYPERILIYGPFVSEFEFFTELSYRLIRRITPLYRSFIKLERVDITENGVAVGSTFPFFLDSMKNILMAKW